jgi:hypothetical protein
MMQNRKVKIEAAADPAGGIDFVIDGVKAKDSRIKLEKDTGSQTFEFELKDQSGRGVQFDSGDPLWVGEDCSCPPPQGMQSDQLSVTECRPVRLSAVNENSGRARELRYQLNFIASDGSRIMCDPVITNGGGTKL